MMLLLVLTGCKTGQKEESPGPAVGVRIFRVSAGNYVEPVRCSGRLSTKTEFRLSFKTGGIISRIRADEGQSVRKGELLAELNPAEIRSAARRAELALSKAERDFQRIENLYRDSVATLEQYQDAGTALDVARANVRTARFNLQYSDIHAPEDGMVLKRLAEENEMIAPGFPVFLFAATRGEWVVRASLTDRDVIRIHRLDSARIVFDAFGEEDFAGRVSEIGAAADPYTGTYEIEIRLTRKPDRLISGLMARLEIYPSGEQGKIIIPYESLVEGAGMSGSVYVLEDKVPLRRKIRIESFSDSGIVVKSGLREGEVIVVEGIQYIHEGIRIEILGQNPE